MQKLTWWACLVVAVLMGCAGEEADDSHGTDATTGSEHSSTESEGDGLGESTSDPDAMHDEGGADAPEAGSTTDDADGTTPEGAGDAAAN